MKRILLLLTFGFLAFNFTAALAQNKKVYAKFTVEPSKKIISSELESNKYHIEYRSRKEATIYLVLLKNGKPVANSVRTIKSKKPKTLTLSLKRFKKAIRSGKYSLKLAMYEGKRDDWSKKLTELFIDNVKVSRL